MRWIDRMAVFRRAAVAVFGAMCVTTAPSLAQQAVLPSLSGTLLIQWVDGERFVYVPDARDPLLFHGKDGRKIQPGRMYTDGGSIPRLFWSAKGFSPWGYGPAYVLHDWLFRQHRCNFDKKPDNYSFVQANQVLDDAIGILMKNNKVAQNQRARRLIKWAVDKYGQDAWNDETCDKPPPEPSPGALREGPPPVTVGSISLSPSSR